MKITPITNCNYRCSNTNSSKSYQQRISQPAFNGLHDDDELFQGPSRGFSILDLFKRKKPKITKEDEEKVLETWDPDLGDISDITDPQRSNFGPLEDLIKAYEEGTLFNEEKIEEEPPSIFNYNED